MLLTGRGASERMLASAMDLLEEAALVVEPEIGVTYSNRKSQELFGNQDGQSFSNWEEACGFSKPGAPNNLLPACDLPWNRIFRGEILKNARFFLRNGRHPSGIWIRVNGEAGLNAAGRAEGAILCVRDISSKLRLRSALRASRRKASASFDESLPPMLRCSAKGVILSCNRAFANICGYDSSAAVRSLGFADVLLPGLQDTLSALTEGKTLSRRAVLAKPNGGNTTTVTLTLQLVDTHGHAPSVIVSVTPESAPSHDNVLDLLQSFPGVIFVKDAFGRFVHLQGGLLEALGIRPEQAIGKTDADLWDPEFAAKSWTDDQDVLAQQKMLRLIRYVPSPRGMRYWTVYKFPISHPSGEYIGGFAFDETDRTQIEDRREHSEKMDAIARLAGAVAHDFNNVLTIFSGYGQMLEDGISRSVEPEKLSGYVEESLNAVRRGVAQTDQLIAFSRRLPGRPRRMDLREQLQKTLPALDEVVGERITLAVEVSEEPCIIRADPSHIQQVIRNLVENACDAMPGGGQVTIRAKQALELPAGAKGEFVMLEVEDFGIGMNELAQARMFEPFFSLKRKGKGAGLGLSAVYGMVKQAGGEIEAVSEPDHGTAFRLFFPVFAGEDGAGPSVPPIAAGIGKTLRGNETILLVEDDNIVRELVHAMLERYGYQTLVADGARQAQELYSENASTIRLLLTDVIMPEVSGCELALSLQALNPELKIMYMSGYTADEIATRGVDGNPVLLQKPFSAETLAKRLREVLDMPARPN